MESRHGYPWCPPRVQLHRHGEPVPLGRSAARAVRQDLGTSARPPRHVHARRPPEGLGHEPPQARRTRRSRRRCGPRCARGRPRAGPRSRRRSSRLRSIVKVGRSRRSTRRRRRTAREPRPSASALGRPRVCRWSRRRHEALDDVAGTSGRPSCAARVRRAFQRRPARGRRLGAAAFDRGARPHLEQWLRDEEAAPALEHRDHRLVEPAGGAPTHGGAHCSSRSSSSTATGSASSRSCPGRPRPGSPGLMPLVEIVSPPGR